MARILCVSTPNVKQHRRSPRPDRPFGAGLLPHTRDDELWLAQHGADDREPTDAEWEAMALQAAWEERWEAAIVGEDRCAACGRIATGELTASLCDACSLAIENGIERCAACQRPGDIDPETSLCPPCLRAAEEKHSASGNRGY